MTDEHEPWTVFVSDPSVDAERVSQALREAKLHVVDVPLSMLIARVAVQKPNVVLVDADAEGALETVARMRELPSADGIDVIFLGRAGAALSTAEDAIANEGSGFFSRPIDPTSVVKKIQALSMGEPPPPPPEPVEPPPPSDRAARPASSPPPKSSPPSAPASVAPPAAGPASVPPAAGPASLPPPSPPVSVGRASPLPPPSARPVPPSSRPPPSVRPPSSRPPPSRTSASPIPSPAPSQARVSLRTGISEELESLLAAADVRAQAQAEAPVISPEDELDAVLPEAILAALDTPLDDADEDDDEPQRGTNSGRGTTSRGRAAANAAAPAGHEEVPPDPVTNGGVGTNAGSTGETGSRHETNAPGGTNAHGTHSHGTNPHGTNPQGTHAQGTHAAGTNAPGTNAPGTNAGGTSLRSTESVPASTSQQHPFGVAPPSPPAATPFMRRSKSSIPPPFGGPAPIVSQAPFSPPGPAPSVMSTTLGSEVLVQAGGMLLPMVQMPTSVPPIPPLSLERRLEPPPPPPLERAPLPPPVPAPFSGNVGSVPSALPTSPLPTSPFGAGSSAPASPPDAPPTAPMALGPGDAARALADAIANRRSGALTFESPEGVRRIVLREGDVVTAASGLDAESLLAFLGARGELPRERIDQLAGRLPPYGRHAGAALVAQGALRQDQLWTVLRAHAEWIMGQVLGISRGSSFLDPEPPGRLRNEPSVFGGSAGAEVFVEVVRRTVDEQSAAVALGGRDAVFSEGPRAPLLNECGLGSAELDALRTVIGAKLDAIVTRFPQTDVTQVLYALALLGVVVVVRAAFAKPQARARTPEADAMDDTALRERIRARVDLVEEGDYFAVLGVMRNATSYEIRRAYVDLRRAFEPSSVLTPATLDLADDVRRIVSVLDEAYEILGDSARRERYRRAIDDAPS